MYKPKLSRSIWQIYKMCIVHCTELIDHSFKRIFYGAWNRLCYKLARRFGCALLKFKNSALIRWQDIECINFVAYTNSEKNACDLRGIFCQKMSRRSHVFFSELVNAFERKFYEVASQVLQFSTHLYLA